MEGDHKMNDKGILIYSIFKRISNPIEEAPSLVILYPYHTSGIYEFSEITSIAKGDRGGTEVVGKSTFWTAVDKLGPAHEENCATVVQSVAEVMELACKVWPNWSCYSAQCSMGDES